MKKRILLNIFIPEDQEEDQEKLYIEVWKDFKGTVEEVRESYYWCDFYVDSIVYESHNVPTKAEVILRKPLEEITLAV